jgi:serine/threonine protein kinase
VPGYRVLGEIAHGGMGRVLTAFDLSLEREVALKVLLPGANADRFVRESKITARLPHPGIPPVHALGTLADGSPFLAMKRIAGQTLAAKLKTADRPRLLQAFAQVCQAVGFAHSRGVVHRDLKPSNVMVGAFGEVQVMDWGLAKELSGQVLVREPGPTRAVRDPAANAGPTQSTDHELARISTEDETQMGAVLGTPSYMAPEQARGEAADARADVFALGGILCAILTGRPPFTGDSRAEVVRRAAAADLAVTNARLDGCGADAEVLALCRQCLSPSPPDRPADGRAVADGITAYLNGVQERLHAAEVARAAETARAAEATRTAAEATRRAEVERRARRNQLIAASLLLAVLAAGIVGTGYGLYWADRAREKAVFAEGETKKRADELQKVSDYQARMLQFDAAEAGGKLMADLRARHRAALKKREVPDPENSARTAAFERELLAVNATDAAVAMLDRTVLAPAVRAIETQFADQPLVDAALRSTLGTVYQKLGRREEALALHQRAYGLRKGVLGPDHLTTLESSLAVGEALGRLQRLPEADRTVRETLAGYQSALGDDHPMTLLAKGLLADQLSLQGKYAESEAVARDVLERRRRVQGPDHGDTLKSTTELGKHLLARGKYADAAKLLREVLEAQRRVGDPTRVETLTELGLVLNRQGEHVAAERYLREAFEQRRRDLGEDHPVTLASMSNLASTLMDSGQGPEKLAEAERLARESLEQCRRTHGNEHAATLAAMNVTGQVLYRQNKFTETEPLYREALETGRRVLGEEHPDVIIWTANLGVLLQRMGRPVEAEPYYRLAVDKNRRQLGETHPYTLTMLKNLVDLLRQHGKHADAEAYLRPALQSVRRVEGEDHPETIRMLGSLGAVLRDAGKLDEASNCFQQYLDACRRRFGEDHANTVTAILRMGSLHVARKQYADAMTLLVPMRDKVRKAIPGNTGMLRHASLLGLLGNAGTGLAKTTADFAAAEANLLEARSVFAKLRGEQDKETRDWTQGLVDLYIAWDRAEPGNGHDVQATTWKEKLPKRAAPSQKTK